MSQDEQPAPVPPIVVRELVEERRVLKAALQRFVDYYDHGAIEEFKSVLGQAQAALDYGKGGA